MIAVQAQQIKILKSQSIEWEFKAPRMPKLTSCVLLNVRFVRVEEEEESTVNENLIKSFARH